MINWLRTINIDRLCGPESFPRKMLIDMTDLSTSTMSHPHLTRQYRVAKGTGTTIDVSIQVYNNVEGIVHEPYV